MPFMNSTNNNGPITLRCTRSLARLVMLDKELLTFVCCDLLVKKFYASATDDFRHFIYCCHSDIAAFNYPGRAHLFRFEQHLQSQLPYK